MNIFDQEVILEFFHEFYLLFIFALYLGSAISTYYLLPKVLWVSREKNLTASVNERSSHAVAVPSFGGVAFYVTIILVLTLMQTMRLTYVGNHVIAAVTILFVVGLKDDLVISTARAKFLGQIAATCFVVFAPEFQLNNLYGFFGIYEIPLALGYSFNALIVIALINAYNLIDGIDGLAAITGIVISGFFAFVYYGTGQAYYVLLSVSIAGILSAYLRFNFSRGKKKIFMGDSGSLIIGLLLAVLTLKHLTMAPIVPLMEQGYDPANRLLFLACILFIPVFDTLRVIIIRLLRGDSPFSADRNHAHHVLLDMGLSHKKASISLALLNIIVVGIYFLLSDKLTHLWLCFVVVCLYASCFLLFTKLNFNNQRTAKRNFSKPSFGN